MKQLLICVLVAAILVSGTLSFRDPLARFVWQNYRSAYGALLLNHGDAGLALEIGNYYFNVGGSGEYDLEKADQYFKLAIAIDPRVPDAWHQRARIAFLKGNFSDALEKINTQISLHPPLMNKWGIHGDGLMASYYIRGLIEGYDHQFDKAIPDFEKFISWDNKNWAAYNDLAWIYFQKGDYRKTEEAADRGLALFPENTWLLTMKGVALLNEGRRVDARKVLIRALDKAKALTAEDWERAYPGNDPAIAEQGLAEMRKAIEFNVGLTHSTDAQSQP